MAEFSIHSLPDLIMWKLFNKLFPVDRCALVSCNKHLLSFIDSPHVWRDVTFVLDVDRSEESKGRVSSVPSEITESLSFSDNFLISKYQQHFQNVRIIISSGYIHRKTFTELSKLCERGVVKSVHIHFDKFLPNVYKRQGNINASSWLCHNLFQPSLSDCPSDPLTIASFIEQLELGTGVTVTLPAWFEHDLKNTIKLHRELISYLVLHPKTKKIHSLLKKLKLPTSPICDHRHQITVNMILRFPNLQEIHVNICNLSDTLLVALSGHGVSKRQTPLRSLVIRYVNKERIPFPQLSSKVWLQMTQSSPSLAMECYVVTDSLPQLDNVIKPETPLVKLKVICTSSDKPNILQLYSLCKSQSSSLQHFHLSISHDEEDLHFFYPVKKALKDMVDACTKLQHLVLDVEACCLTLVELATSGRQWRTFQYNLEAIVCCKDKMANIYSELPDYDYVYSGALEYDRIEEATGFPYSPATVQDFSAEDDYISFGR